MYKILLTLCVLSFTEYLFAQQERPEWVQIDLPFDEGFIIGDFISADEGWINTDEDNLYHTSDGGATFEKIFQHEDSSVRLGVIRMQNSNLGFMLAFNWDNDDEYIFKTTDGGKSWTNIFDAAFFSQFDFLYYDVYFINENTGFTSMYLDRVADIYKTTDGAKTWQKTEFTGYEQLDINRDEVGAAVKFHFINQNIGWALCERYGSTGEGFILKTHDGGLNWQVASLISSTGYSNIDCISPLKCGAVGSNSHNSEVALTEDNFETLAYRNKDWGWFMGQFASQISYQNDSIIWISGRGGMIYQSTDNGQNFNLHTQTDLFWILNLEFFNGNTGYLFGDSKLLKFVDTLPPTVNISNIPLIGFSIFPNPASQNLNIQFNELISGKIEIYNSLSQKVFMSSVNSTKEYQINISEFKTGFYTLLFINNANEKIQRKFIVK